MTQKFNAGNLKNRLPVAETGLLNSKKFPVIVKRFCGKKTIFLPQQKSMFCQF
jgi:hypothetical protein